MKHILTTNEPFLLERDNIQSNVYESSGIRYNDLPFLSYIDGNNTIDLTRAFVKLLYSGNTGENGPGIFAGYFAEEYSTSNFPSLSSDLGSFLVGRCTHGVSDLNSMIIFDLGRNIVYNLVISYSGYNLNEIWVKNVSNFKFSTSQVFYMEKEFGTHVWFTLGLKQYQPLPGTTSTDTDPEYWVYSLDLKPIYWEKVKVQRSIVELLVRRLENNQSIDEWEDSNNEDEIMMSDIAYLFYPSTATSAISALGNVWTYLTPNVYWDLTFLGGISGRINFLANSGIFSYDVPAVRMMSIIGRFVAGSNSLSLSSSYTDMIFPTTNPQITNGHTYEFNIYDGVFNLIDITEES